MAPSSFSEDDIREILKQVKYPGYSRDIVSFGLVKDVRLQGGRSIVTIQAANPKPEVLEQIENDIKKAIGKAAPGLKLLVHFEELEPRPTPGEFPRETVDGVKSIIAVASGKGGVGKSTVAVNLAVALKRHGRVGLMDSDIYGPSIPTMLALEKKPYAEGNKIFPVENYGIPTMSMGFFVEEGNAVIWRGPMVMKAVTQFLRDVAWGELDYLVIDLPPGTGDAQLTLVQTVPLSGAVIVTTPQDVALIDARKGVAMFRKTGVEIIGIVENMSYFLCGHCGEESDIFGRGGGRAEAEKLGVPFLGEIPLDTRVRESGDIGRPITVADSESATSKIFSEIAGRVASRVSTEVC